MMKNQPYILLIALVILFSSHQVNGQNKLKNGASQTNNASFNTDFCGTDFFHNKKMKNDPEYKARHLKTIQSIKKASSKHNKMLSGTIYQVPVVVHVMHKGESVGTGTNISDEDVKKGIEYLNNYWRKVSGSNGFGDGVDMEIEFALAIQDENGNCTNGIDRVDMSGVPAYVSNGVNRSASGGIPDYSSTGGINSLKEYSIWDSTKYYNVWIVDEIDNKNCYTGGPFTTGYASFASSHGQANDGAVVLICTYLNESSTTWAHEMGHAFNLPHTFGNDSNGTSCGDDGIDDTPSHIRTSAISPSIYNDCDNSDANNCDLTFNQVINPDTGFVRNSGTHQDHMHNYMDYTGCPTEFTGGQRSEVQAALTTARASFLTSLALTPPLPATVFFTSSVENVCSGASVKFTDESTCTPNTYTNTGYNGISFLWTFDNGVNPQITSTDQNPTITFVNPGSYDVTLQITNNEGTTSLTKADNISVSSGVSAACTLSSFNDDGNYGTGVTNVSFNTISKATSTYVPNGAMQDYTCSDNTTVYVGNTYNLDVDYKTSTNNTGPVFLEVWIDWDNSGTFQTSNANGVNERVLEDDIVAGTTGSPSVSITPPATAMLNTLLRMRVVSNYNGNPNVCGNGSIQRGDDYGVYVKPACTRPTAGITNNSGVTVLTCLAPSINVTATGGVSYLWDNNKGISPNISITEPGTYTVTVTSVDGCTDTESIVITENKPAPTVVITNNTGSTALTCSLTSISLTASGGSTYSWDNGLGNNATVTITESGTYTVTVTAANACTATETIVITDEQAKPACSISSTNDDGTFGAGVTNISFNTIGNITSTYIPAGAMNNFICSDNTNVDVGASYDLDVTYYSLNAYSQYLEVWIDWDNSGAFELSNSNGDNELVLADNVASGNSGPHNISANVTPPVDAALNTLLRMRVMSNAGGEPTLCGNGFVQRADDYGVMVSSTLSVNNVSELNSKFTIYPNPVKNILNVSLGKNGTIRGYEVYDITGKKVMSKLKTNENIIKTSELPNGFYFLRVKTDTTDLMGKFTKE